MTTFERIKRTYDHEQADRVPIWDKPWQGTIKRWQSEGLPKGLDYRDYFGLDKIYTLHPDISPRFEEITIEETKDYKIKTTKWGVTMKEFKELDSTPEFIDFKTIDPPNWEQAKKMMDIKKDRLDWKLISENYKSWRAEGAWIQGLLWFGFDVTHSWSVGTETLLIAMHEQPEWVMDMFNHYLEMSIAHLDMLWDAGFTFDEIFWYDDMGYKNTTFFSLDTYRTLLKPFHKRAVEWAHKKGIYAHLHSCGYVMPLIPELIEIGVDALHPIEIKAGMDVVKIKEEYGDKLTLHGGISALLWDNKHLVIAKIEELLPTLMQKGGYIFSSDHSVPNSVSFDTFSEIIKVVKKIGKY